MEKKRTEFEAIVISVILIVMLGLVFVGVLSRYIFHFSFSFTEELVCAMFVLLGTVGSAFASRCRSLYTMDLVTGMLRPKTKIYFSIFNTLLTIGVAAFLIWASFSMIQTQAQMGSTTVALKLPSWLYTSFVPFGLAFMVFRNIQNIWKDIQELKKLKEGNNS